MGGLTNGLALINNQLNNPQGAAYANSLGAQTGINTSGGGNTSPNPNASPYLGGGNIGYGGPAPTSSGFGTGGPTGGGTGSSGGGSSPTPPAGSNTYTSDNGVQWVNGQPWQAGNPVFDAMSGGKNQMGAAPTPIAISPNANSNDPNTITGPNYAYGNNVGDYQQSVNNQNNLAYSNYQNAYNNWLQGGAVGPAPSQPNYASFDQNAFNSAWQQGQQNGVQSGAALNSSINPGSVFANNPSSAPGYYVGGPGGTYTAGPSGINGNGVSLQGTPQGNYQNGGNGAPPMATGAGNTQGGGGAPQPMQGQSGTYNPAQGSVGGGNPIQSGIIGGGGNLGFGLNNTTFPGQQNGTQFGGFNGWGQPGEGNPFSYMTGQSNNGLNGRQFTSTGNAPGMFSQQPLSFGYGNMNPLVSQTNSNNQGGNAGNMAGLMQLFSMMGL